MARLARGFGAGLALSLVAALFATPALARSAAEPGLASVGDDKTTVCTNTSRTAKAGLEQFAGDLNNVSQQAQGGDLAAANQSVRQAGSTLAATGKKITEQGANANDAPLKQATADLGAEFQKLGGGLTDLTGLQNLDTTKLEELGTQVSQLCGVTPSPGGSFGAPSPTAPTPGGSLPGGNPLPTRTS